jgi:hypothetical protein
MILHAILMFRALQKKPSLRIRREDYTQEGWNKVLALAAAINVSGR